MCGMPGITPSSSKTPALTPSTRGDMNNCWTIWRPMSWSLPTRAITIAAAIEINRPGICATSASPMASKKVVVGALPGRQAMLQHANGEAPDDIDQQDQYAGHGIAAHELGGAIHRAEK